MLKRAIRFLIGANADHPDAWGHGFAFGMIVGILLTMAFAKPWWS